MAEGQTAEQRLAGIVAEFADRVQGAIDQAADGDPSAYEVRRAEIVRGAQTELELIAQEAEQHELDGQEQLTSELEAARGKARWTEEEWGVAKRLEELVARRGPQALVALVDDPACSAVERRIIAAEGPRWAARCPDALVRYRLFNWAKDRLDPRDETVRRLEREVRAGPGRLTDVRALLQGTRAYIHTIAPTRRRSS